jgi:hypothetical protein
VSRSADARRAQHVLGPDDHLVASESSGDQRPHSPLQREHAGVKSQFIVSRTKPGTYNYMKLVSDSERDVILDRRKGDRRQLHQRAMPGRRHGERRRRDIMTDLQKSGWVLVRPSLSRAS